MATILNFLRMRSLRLLLCAAVLVNQGSASSKRHEEKAYRDVNAIGHRDLGCEKGMGNWYSVDQEKSAGAEWAASFERSNPLLRDSATDTYLDTLAQKIAHNSDAQFPITIHVIDTDDSYSFTLPGGYQYITRGLLLQAGSEGELAAELARGIAHTAMCTEARLQTRANLAQLATIPLIFAGSDPANGTSHELSVPLTMLKFKRAFELRADYFGIQYLYKSGYDPESFIHFVQKVWPQPLPGQASVAFSSFPPTVERVKALEKEVSEILPKRDGAVTDTPEFVRFHEHLLTLAPPKPATRPAPRLIRPDEQHSN